MLTPAQHVKVGFLLKCADAGLTHDEIHQLVKLGLRDKRAFIEKLFDVLSSGVGTAIKTIPAVGSFAMTGGLLTPLAAGAGAGYVLAKSKQGDETDIEEAKQDELENEYRRLAAAAESNSRRRRLQSLTGKRVTRLGGPRLAS